MDGRGRVRLGQIHLDSTHVQGVGGTVALAQIYMQADDRQKVVSNNHMYVTHSMLAIRDESSEDEKDNAKTSSMLFGPLLHFIRFLCGMSDATQYCNNMRPLSEFKLGAAIPRKGAAIPRKGAAWPLQASRARWPTSAATRS